jgi:zinc/manganese transport system permease protein
MFDILHYAFIQNAFLTGFMVAVVAAIAGYFLLVRGLTFAAHALPNIGFAGAAGAVLLGVNPVAGLLLFTVGAGIAIGLLGKQMRERDIAIGIIMAFALGLGLLFLSLYSGYTEQAYSILFGTILGISRTDVLVTALFSVIITGILLANFRPLLFSSYDPEVAQARGIPVRLLGVVYLVILAVTISMAVQVVGALLVFTLLVGPAATAMRIVQRPLWAILLAIVLGVCYTWAGIFLAANGANFPVSFYIATLSFAVYLPVRLLSPIWIGRRARKDVPKSQQLAPEPPGALDEEREARAQTVGRVQGSIR